MKLRALLILLMVAAAMAPLFFLYKWMQRMLRPRDSVARLFLFLFANFVVIVAYTVLVVGLIVKIFPR